MQFDPMDIYIALGAAFLTVAMLGWADKLPTTPQLQDIMTILNSRGGNILVLSILTVYFFWRSEHMYYVVLAQIQSNSLTSDNGIALNGLSFDTGVASAAFGALLKTMSPDSNTTLNSNTQTQTKTQKTEEVVAKVPVNKDDAH